jgi:hypothetical protein
MTPSFMFYGPGDPRLRHGEGAVIDLYPDGRSGHAATLCWGLDQGTLTSPTFSAPAEAWSIFQHHDLIVWLSAGHTATPPRVVEFLVASGFVDESTRPRIRRALTPYQVEAIKRKLDSLFDSIDVDPEVLRTHLERVHDLLTELPKAT